MFKKILLVVAMILWTIPFLIMLLIALSSKNTNTFSELFSIGDMTFANFINAWQEAEFSKYFLNTMIITVASVVIILMVTAFAGYIIGCFAFRGKKFLSALMMVSMGIPTIFFTIPVYQILRMLHCESSLVGLILAEIGGAHVIFILLFANFFRSLPGSCASLRFWKARAHFRSFSRLSSHWQSRLLQRL